MIDGSTRALVLAPHTDDGELGVGGAVAKWVEMGVEVHWLTFSGCEESVVPGFEPDDLRREQYESLSRLGIPRARTQVLDFPVRRFNDRRQDVLQILIETLRESSPNLVLAPDLTDIHQDHRVVAEEAVRAFKRTNLLGYESAWNQADFCSRAFVHLEHRHVAAKLDALAAYRSQSSRPYFDPEFTLSQLRYHGVRAGCGYAEALNVIRLQL